MSNISDDFRGDINFGVGEIYGIRKWKITPDGMLRSMSYPSTWTTGVNTAECLKSWGPHEEEHTSPKKECTCGYWAYYDPTGQYQNSAPANANVSMFEGVIKAWGKVIAGDRGFRTQYATIVAICVQPPVELQYIQSETRFLRASILKDVIGMGFYPDLDIVAKRAELLDKYPLSTPLRSIPNEQQNQTNEV